MKKPWGMAEAIFTFFMGTGRPLKETYMHTPLKEADTKYLCPNINDSIEWFQDGLNNPKGTKSFCEGKRECADFHKLMKTNNSSSSSIPPVLIFGGWYAFFSPEQLQDFQNLQTISDDCHLVVGPYSHWHIISMQPKLFQSLFDFFDLHLQQKMTTKVLQKVDVFTIGHNEEWKQMASWPLPVSSIRTYSLDDGSVMTRVDDTASSSNQETVEVSYIYDTMDPTPQIGGSTFNPSNCGRLDQREVEKRNDVLVFTTNTITDKPRTISGRIKVHLSVESSVVGTDYIARACHVTLNGISQNIADRIIRRFDIPCGKKIAVEIILSHVMNRLAIEDYLRIQICSSAYPNYGRHLNTKQPFYLKLKKNVVLSEQKLFLGGKEGCHVQVLIIC